MLHFISEDVVEKQQRESLLNFIWRRDVGRITISELTVAHFGNGKYSVFYHLPPFSKRAG